MSHNPFALPKLIDEIAAALHPDKVGTRFTYVPNQLPDMIRQLTTRDVELTEQLDGASLAVRQLVLENTQLTSKVAELETSNAVLRTALEACGKYMGEDCRSPTCPCPAGIARHALSSEAVAAEVDNARLLRENEELRKAPPRVLYACKRCGEAFGEGEDDNGKCPHCRRGRGEPIGECDDLCDEAEKPTPPLVDSAPVVDIMEALRKALGGAKS